MKRRKTPYNIGLEIWRLRGFYETVVQGSAFVLRMDISVKIRHIAKPKNVRCIFNVTLFHCRVSLIALCAAGHGLAENCYRRFHLNIKAMSKITAQDGKMHPLLHLCNISPDPIFHNILVSKRTSF